MHEVEAWPDRSIYSAVAWMAWEAQQQADVCQSCHTSRDGWKNDTGRVVSHPDYELEEVNCEGCRRLAEAQKSLSEEERAYVRMRFRSSERPPREVDD